MAGSGEVWKEADIYMDPTGVYVLQIPRINHIMML